MSSSVIYFHIIFWKKNSIFNTVITLIILSLFEHAVELEWCGVLCEMKYVGLEILIYVKEWLYIYPSLN